MVKNSGLTPGPGACRFSHEHEIKRDTVQQILSAQAKEGMILAKDVETPEGRVLCGKGTILSANLVERLLKMDISHVTVEGHPIEVPGEKTLKEELQLLEARFKNVKHIPPLTYIKKRLMKKLIASRS